MDRGATFPEITNDHKRKMLKMLVHMLTIRDQAFSPRFNSINAIDADAYSTLEKIQTTDRENEFNILGYFIDKDIFPPKFIYPLIRGGFFSHLRDRNQQDIITTFRDEINTWRPQFYNEVSAFFNNYNEMKNGETQDKIENIKPITDFLRIYGRRLHKNSK